MGVFRHSAEKALRSTQDASLDVRAEMQREIDRLLLVNEAMWSLLSERLGLTEEALMARMQELDLQDGHLDGKLVKAPVQCPQCSRQNGRRHLTCLYCGADLPPVRP